METIDWDDPAIVKTGINNSIYIWNPNLGQYASYVGGISNNGGSKYIASSQAFWIQATNSSAAFQVAESVKSVEDISFLKQNVINSLLTIEVNNNQGKDQTILNIEPNATTTFDAMFDARKIYTVNDNVPSISSFLENVEYSINQIPQTDIAIPIKVTSPISGFHNIKFKGLSNFSHLSCLILEDLFTGNSYDLKDSDSLMIYISDTTTVARFLLNFGVESTHAVNHVSCFGNNDGSIFYDRKSSYPFQIVWKNSIGDTIATNSNAIGNDSLMNVGDGTYFIETAGAVCGLSTDTVTINQPLKIDAQFSNNSDTTYLSNGAIVNFINTSNNAIFYRWDFGDGDTSNLISPFHTYLSTGMYQVSLNAYQNNYCFEQFTKNMVVLDHVTSINDESISPKTKVWINQNNLFVKGKSIDKIEVRSVLGQVLFSSFNSNNSVFDLEGIPSQILLVNTAKEDKTSSTKIIYLRK